MENPNEDLKRGLADCTDKFDTIFKLTSIASKVIDPDLTILKVNDALEDLLGYSAAEIVGTKILDYACPDHIEHWNNLQNALWDKKLPFFKLDACLIKKDSSLVWVNVTTVLFRENNQTFGYTVLDNFTYRKIYEESEKQLKEALEQSKRVQEDLHANEQRLKQVLETMAEGVGIIDTNGKLTYANPMAQKILGLNKKEIQNRFFADPKWRNLRIDGSPLPEEEHPMSVMMSNGKAVYDAEISVQPESGERFYISINAAPLYDDHGNVAGGIGTFMDVTSRRKLTLLKDEFISVASHELRTPVTSLKAALQLLSRMKGSSSNNMMPRLIDQANKSLNKVSVLIGDLLNASKLNEGQLHLTKTHFVLSKLIEDSCYHIRVTGEYIIKTEGDLDLIVYADADRIEQVITNFVNNAIKYAPESKEIIIKIEMYENVAKVIVTDKGQGIAAEKTPHLFNRYYRVDNSGNQYSGLGLGLYINSEIIKRHNGEIGVDSIPDIGSSFWFTLPL